jgi:hypothetical protein
MSVISFETFTAVTFLSASILHTIPLSSWKVASDPRKGLLSLSNPLRTLTRNQCAPYKGSTNVTINGRRLNVAPEVHTTSYQMPWSIRKRSCPVFGTSWGLPWFYSINSVRVTLKNEEDRVVAYLKSLSRHSSGGAQTSVTLVFRPGFEPGTSKRMSRDNSVCIPMG